MSLGSLLRAEGRGGRPDVLWEDDERRFCRMWRDHSNGDVQEFLAVTPAAEHPTPGLISRLTHEYGLRDHLERDWAALPLELVSEGGRTVLLFEPSSRVPLDRLIGAPMEIALFLRVASTTSSALGRMHQRGLVHKDVKPSNILIDSVTEQIWLTGFGIASRLLRERPSPDPLELITGTLAYMAPEQTGRMNRSVDSRSDLYSLGVVLYQMITGALPFVASEPMEWVHCHIARKPTPPTARVHDIPAQVSAVIMKLLAKTPEERYQTAAGVEHDLRQCLADWETGRGISVFSLGERDRLDRLVIPEKLYGRGREIAALLSSFEEVVATNTPALVLVAGYSGVGKSSVVNELQRMLVSAAGLFVSGKFDQHKTDIPYAPFAQAFQMLTRLLLGKPEAELSGWREALLEALNPNGALLLDLVPELSLIIGEQPPVVTLPAQDAQHRFQLVVRRFVGVFARPEHPLVLFLDDLQWLDAATLDLVASLLMASDLHQLLLIGAYRDNEVSATHPLRLEIDRLIRSGSSVRTLTLPSLGQSDLEQLIADALRTAPERAAPLAELLRSKTGGNPFFANQFLNSLAAEGLLCFDHAAAEWSWDRERTLEQAYTDNVVELMVRKLARLPTAAQQALQQLACLGNAADRSLLYAACARSAEAVDADLWEALQHEMLLCVAGQYRFSHDRVQEAAYSLIPEESRPQLHLQTGRRLVSHTPVERRKEAVFEIVNQLNRAVSLITAPEEREQLAELNLLAGKRAKASTAYASALEYLKVGTAALPENCWTRRHSLAFSLELEKAECEYLTGDLAAAEQHLSALLPMGLAAAERATVTCLRIDLYINLAQSDAAIAAGLEFLRHLGVDWSAHPTAEEVQLEYELVWKTLGNRTTEELVDLPLMSDPAHLGMLDVLITLTTPAWLTDLRFLFLVTCRAVNLSLAHGNCDASCVAYVLLGALAGPHYGRYAAGYGFSKLAHQLVDERGLTRFQARTYLFFGHLVLSWTKHLRVAREVLWRAHENANKVGNLLFAAISARHVNVNLLAAGDPLEETQRAIEDSLEFARRRELGLVVLTIIPQLGFVRSLRGLTPTFGVFDDGQIDEREVEAQLASNAVFAIAECFHWIRKLQARFFAGDYASAIAASSRVKPLLWTATGQLETAEYHLYGALSIAASCQATGLAEDAIEWVALDAHYRQLAAWAQECPENFESRALLVAGEMARLQTRDLDAMSLYDQAIRSAQANGFVHQEAVANELAGRFYIQRGFEEIGRLYLRTARHAYVRWGAHGKVQQLEALYPHLREAQTPSLASTMATPIDHLELTTVIRISQTISSEIVLEKLIEAVMRAAIEHAGAARGLLILAREDGYRIEAEALTNSDALRVTLRQAGVGATELPESVFNYVVRTRESVLLHDARVNGQFSGDAYLRDHDSRSVHCLPLIKQSRLVGVLYLENNLSTDVFTPARISLLKLLASEAATSIENSRLYRDLEERQARVRRLVDSNIIGIFIAALDGRILDANQAFLRIVGYEREDLNSGLLRWTELTPAEWWEADAQRVAEIAANGVHEPYEKEFFRKDGTRAPVLLGSALFDGTQKEGVSFVLDLTERKQAEGAARESERRYQEMQMELSHANRVATVGQFSASIAHEVNQPLSGVLTNASTCLRMLEVDPPNIEGARETTRRAIRDTNRAADVVRRLRSLFAKTDSTLEPLQLNELILEVVALSRAELRSRRVSLRLELVDGLPRIEGDRIQLQQVMLNLIRNAIDAMSVSEQAPRQLLISTARGAGGVLVCVEDSGPGVESTHFERIFDAFYSTKPGGLGVGLSISSAIVEAHRGRLWATPVLPHGAMFQFSLPLAASCSGMS